MKKRNRNFVFVTNHFLLQYLSNAIDLFQYQFDQLMLLVPLLNPLFEQQEENSQLLMEFVDTKYQT